MARAALGQMVVCVFALFAVSASAMHALSWGSPRIIWPQIVMAAMAFMLWFVDRRIRQLPAMEDSQTVAMAPVRAMSLPQIAALYVVVLAVIHAMVAALGESSFARSAFYLATGLAMVSSSVSLNQLHLRMGSRSLRNWRWIFPLAIGTIFVVAMCIEFAFAHRSFVFAGLAPFLFITIAVMSVCWGNAGIRCNQLARKLEDARYWLHRQQSISAARRESHRDHQRTAALDPRQIDVDLLCACGYNLRGLARDKDCPECGESVRKRLGEGELHEVFTFPVRVAVYTIIGRPTVMLLPFIPVLGLPALAGLAACIVIAAAISWWYTGRKPPVRCVLSETMLSCYRHGKTEPLTISRYELQAVKLDCDTIWLVGSATSRVTLPLTGKDVPRLLRRLHAWDVPIRYSAALRLARRVGRMRPRRRATAAPDVSS